MVMRGPTVMIFWLLIWKKNIQLKHACTWVKLRTSLITKFPDACRVIVSGNFTALSRHRTVHSTICQTILIFLQWPYRQVYRVCRLCAVLIPAIHARPDRLSSMRRALLANCVSTTWTTQWQKWIRRPCYLTLPPHSVERYSSSKSSSNGLCFFLDLWPIVCCIIFRFKKYVESCTQLYEQGKGIIFKQNINFLSERDLWNVYSWLACSVLA